MNKFQIYSLDEPSLEVAIKKSEVQLLRAQFFKFYFLNGYGYKSIQTKWTKLKKSNCNNDSIVIVLNKEFIFFLPDEINIYNYEKDDCIL
jgi:hypothetical protein